MAPVTRQQTVATSVGTVQNELLGLLEEWRRLTQQESEAIQRNDWAGVAEHQNCKKSLRETITRVQQRQGPRPATSLAGCSEQETRFQAVLAEVVALERRNGEVLSAKRQQRQEELLRLNQASRHLQGVRRAYGTTNQHWWQSYS